MNLRELILEITPEKSKMNFLRKKVGKTPYVEENEKQVGFILFVLRQMTDASEAKSVRI